jgi:hypothetical protein
LRKNKRTKNECLFEEKKRGPKCPKEVRKPQWDPHGNMVGSVLHAFVPIVEASKHANTLTHLFQVHNKIMFSPHQDGHVWQQAFSQQLYTTHGWVLKLFIAMYTCLLFCSFHIFNKFTCVHQGALKHNNISNKL